VDFIYAVYIIIYQKVIGKDLHKNIHANRLGDEPQNERPKKSRIYCILKIHTNPFFNVRYKE